MKMQNQTEQPPYESLGRFISLAASFEFIVNTVIESIYSNEKIIDYLQKQSMDTRIDFIRNHLFVTNQAYEKLKPELLDSSIHITYLEANEVLDSVMECYQLYKPFRDLVAHSPLFEIIYKEKESIHRIISSRRNKPNRKNSILLDHIMEINIKLETMLDKILNMSGHIVNFCGPMTNKKEIFKTIT